MIYCRICGSQIPDDSVFCPMCGKKVLPFAAAEPPCVSAAVPEWNTRVFEYPKGTTYDQASIPVNTFLEENGLRILDARFTLDAVLLAGTMVPTLSRIEIDWREEAAGAPYRLGVMMDSRADFGLAKKKGAKSVQRQFDRWRAEHPEYEIAGKQDSQLTIGWTNAWVSCFFYR